MSSRKMIAAITAMSFVLSTGPLPAWGAQSEKETSPRPAGRRHETGVLTGHSWFKSWGSPAEEEGLKALEQRRRAAAEKEKAGKPKPVAPQKDVFGSSQMRASQAEDQGENSPVRAGLEEALREVGQPDGITRRNLLKLVGAGAAALGLGPLAEAAAVAFPASAALLLAPALYAGQLDQPQPTFLNWLNRPDLPQEIRGIVSKLDREALKQEADRTREWFAKQRMGKAVAAPSAGAGEPFEVQGYRSYLSNPDHPYDRFLGVERFWVYDQGVVLTYLIRRGEVEQAKELARWMEVIERKMSAQDQKGGWRFSYGETFTDARAMSGGVGWLFKGLYAVALHTRNQTFLNWVNGKLEEIAFPLQVMDEKDPRYGLFRAGYGSGNEYATGVVKERREEITTEHNWDYIEVLRLAYRATRLVDPDSETLPELLRRHELAMQKSKEKLLLTEQRIPEIQGQLARLVKRFSAAIAATEDDEKKKELQEQLEAIRKQHQDTIQEIPTLPGKRRWATGMNVEMSQDGKEVLSWDVNLSWAWDNEGWSPHGAYDPDLGYDELRNLEARFLVTLKAKEFSHLPEGADPEEEFTGLIFFTGEFGDAHVPANPDYEKMIQPEATWGYIFRLQQFGYHTSDPARRAWAYGLSARVMDSMLRLSRLYGGAPYATKDIEGFFNTMLAVSSNGHQGIVLDDLLSGRPPADDYLNVLPHPEMRVGGKAAVWAAPETPLQPEKAAPMEKEQPAPKKPAAAIKLTAEVSPEEMTITLPKALAGMWAGAWLKTGQYYKQSARRVGDDGQVTLRVYRYDGTPSFPGWVAANGRRIALARSEDDLRGSPSGEVILEVGKPDARGRAEVKVVKGAELLQKAAPARQEEKKEEMEPAPVMEPEPAPAVAAGKNVMEPLKAWVQADAKRQLPTVVWNPKGFFDPDTGRWALPGFFERQVAGGVTIVFVSGYRFLDLTEAQQQELFDRAAKAGVKTIGLLDGNVDWVDGLDWAQQNIYAPLLARLLALKPHAYGLQIAFGLDVEPHTPDGRARGWRGTDEDYRKYALMVNQAVGFVQGINSRYEEVHGKEKKIVYNTWLYRFEPTHYKLDKAKTGVDLSYTTIAGMTYDVDPAALTAAGEALRRRAAEEGTGVGTLIGAETQDWRNPDFGLSPRNTFHGKLGTMPGALLGALEKLGDARGAFLHFGSPAQADADFKTLTGAAQRVPPREPARPAAPRPEAAGIKVQGRMEGNTLTISFTGVQDGIISAWVQDGSPDGERGVYYQQPRGDAVSRLVGGKATIENYQTDPRRRFQGNRVRVVLVKDDEAQAYLKRRLAQTNRGKDDSYFTHSGMDKLRGDASFVQRTGIVFVDVTESGAKIVPKAGLEEFPAALVERFLAEPDAPVVGPVGLEDILGIPQLVVGLRWSGPLPEAPRLDSIPAVLTQTGFLPEAVIAGMERWGWRVELLPEDVTPDRLVGEVTAALAEWDGDILVVVGSGLEEGVKRLPAYGRVTALVLDPGMARALAPDHALWLLYRALNDYRGHFVGLESVVQAGLESADAFGRQL